MTDAIPAEPRERELRLRYSGNCRLCGTPLAAGERARWDPGTRTIHRLVCPTTRSVPDEPRRRPSSRGSQAFNEPRTGVSPALPRSASSTGRKADGVPV